MTRKAFLKTYFLRFALILALLGLTVFVIAHAMGNLSGSLVTTPVRQITDTRLTSTTAYLFREEEVLTVPHPGLLEACVESGAKVGRDVELARVYFGAYEEESLGEKQAALESLLRSIRILEASQLPPGTGVIQAEAYRTEALEAYLELCRLGVSGSFGEAADLEERFLIARNRYLALTSGLDLSARLSELTAEKDALLTGNYSTVTNERASGVFYDAASIDGYETLFTPSALETLTPSALDALANQEPTTLSSGMAVGKVAYGYAWYLALTVDASLAESFAIGNSYEITLPENGSRTLTVTLERKTTEGDRTLLVLRSDRAPEDMVYYRRQTVHISLGETTGFYLPDSALHTVDGVEGVYVLQDSILHFRRVDILYRGDGYCVASMEEGTELSLNDILVTSGKNLYDGKGYT